MVVHTYYMTSFEKTNQIITQGLFHFIAPKLMRYPCTVPIPTVKIYIANWYAFFLKGMYLVFTSSILMCKILTVVIVFFECMHEFYFPWLYYSLP